MSQDINMKIANIIREVNNSSSTDKIYLFGSYAYGNPD